MTNRDLATLVNDICNNLFSNRKLITTNSVLKLVTMYGSWDDYDLEIDIPRMIKAWRLEHLSVHPDCGKNAAHVIALEEQLHKCQREIEFYKSELKKEQRLRLKQHAFISNEIKTLLRTDV